MVSGTKKADRATLTVSPPPCAAVPSVEESPTSLAVTAPGKASVHGQGGHGPTNCSPATIQWQVSTNGVNWNNVSGGNVSGATSATLSIKPTEHLGIGQ